MCIRLAPRLLTLMTSIVPYREFNQTVEPEEPRRIGRYSDLFRGDPVPPPGKLVRVSLPTGKLGIKQEPAGKVRVFAMVDPFTQWFLNPIHEILFFILRKWPMDGTFNQLRPILRLLKIAKKAGLPLYSLDLSSATDRIPVSIQAMLLDNFIWEFPHYGASWRRILVERSYWIKSEVFDVNKSVTYGVGQPMGALSSWAMLATVHHFIVQVAAWETGWCKTRLFTKYALLGDDVVIASKVVMTRYLEILEGIGVKCGLHKSVLSPKGIGLEFAKRTFCHGHDVSPVSWLELETSLADLSTWAAFAKKHGLSLVRQFRILGHGYISRRKPFRRLNHACQLVWLTSVAKLSMNSQSMSLWGRLPGVFQGLLPMFKKEVLGPLYETLLTYWQDFSNLKKRNPEAWFRSMGCHEYYLSSITSLYDSWFRAEYSKNTWSIWEKLISELRPYDKIETFDEALALYLKILSNKTIPQMDIFRLRPLATNKGSGKRLPLQVTMFRKWSRVVFKIIKRIRKEKANIP